MRTNGPGAPERYQCDRCGGVCRNGAFTGHHPFEHVCVWFDAVWKKLPQRGALRDSTPLLASADPWLTISPVEAAEREAQAETVKAIHTKKEGN